MLVLVTLVPHHETVSLVHLDCTLVQMRMAGLKFGEEPDRELLASLTRPQPHLVEVAFVAEVLGDCNR